MREWRKDGLRQADYTRKTQEVSETRKQYEANLKLTEEIVADDAMGSFISAHPAVLPKLLADPENTRAILGDAEEIQALWDDYELISNNPRLAERFHGKDEGAEEALANKREAENIQAIATYLDQRVGDIAKEYEGVDADKVREYVLNLGRVPVGDNVDPAEVKDAFGRLFSLMFVQDESGSYDLDETLIRSRYEQLASAHKAAASSSSSEADEHNKSVDAKLADSAPPASKGGSGAGPERESLPKADSLNSVIHDLMGYGD